MKRKTKNLLKRIVLILAVAGFVLWVSVHDWGDKTTPPYAYTIARGASVSSVAADLTSRGVISSPDMFKFAVRFYGGKIQSGVYDIPSNAGAFRIARMMARGDIATTRIVIPEGLTMQQVRMLLMASSQLTGEIDCAPNENLEICNLRDGDIFPDTYRVARGTSRRAVLELARKKMVSIQDAWASSGKIAPSPIKTWNEIITLASIVQKETPRSAEMPIVASVYINRLRKNMRLQADPTVVYALTNGLGDMQGAPLLRSDLQIDSPYNTYKNRGLPPAPIANVGSAAIRAVLKPADTNYFYFVADGHGGHKFATDYDQHIKNQADWRAIKNSKNKN